MDSDARSISVRLDGQASIEHQIDIHVMDLVDASDNTEITVIEVLHGLKYVADYRLSGERLPHLDFELMKRLLKGLLKQTHIKKGNLLNQRPTEEANLAFVIFGDYLSNVVEFRQAVGELSSSDLRCGLKIHRRCQPRSLVEHRKTAASLLGLLTLRFPQFCDWKDLVDEDEHDDIERLMMDYPAMFQSPAIPVIETLYPPPALYFDKNAEALAAMYHSSTTVGLKTENVENLRKFYGFNRLPSPPKRSLLKMIWTQITDFMVIILLIASIVEFATGDFKAAIVLIVVVLINVVIGATQEYKANQALEALLTLTVAKASVIRDGVQLIIDSAELVPGDLVVLEEGEAIPADLRLCEVSQLDIIESILTGESISVSKSMRTIRQKTRKLPLSKCKGNAFMTTVCSRGRGKGIVVRTGLSTEIGKISNAISSTPHTKTSIEIKLSKLGTILVIIAIGLCIVIVVIGILWKRDARDTILVGLSLAVSVIPEGLVAVVTISMALAVQRMALLKAIVRKLPSVETIGSVTVICSDKTGTLTEGKMGAQIVWTCDNTHYTISNSTSLDPLIGGISKISSDSLQKGMDSNELSVTHGPQPVSKTVESIPGHLASILLISTLCNNSAISFDAETESWKSVGDSTEIALLVAGIRGGVSKDSLNCTKLGEYAFDSDRKLMSSIFTFPQQSDSAFVLAKGAPEAVLRKCSGYLVPSQNNGMTHLKNLLSAPLSDQFVEFLSNQSADLASSGLRVLAMAIRRTTLEDAKSIIKSGNHSNAETDLIFVGFVGLIDPPKKGVHGSIAISKKAGIKVVMITGDHVATATAIAKDLGIIDVENVSERRTMQGFEVDLLSEDILAAQNPFPVVFARVSPDNKLKIVKALQKGGHSVLMTGDGVNDAPAIKQADVGVAMGLSGTEITKQAADIILEDDNFTTIVAAVKEGRHVYDNILKFVVYLLSCNAAEVLLFLLCAMINADLPFTTIQILWANIFADIPPALSLGLEPAEIDLMDRNPRPPKQNVLTGLSITIILIQSSLMTLITFGVYYMSINSHFAGADTPIKQQSLAFVLLTTMQLVQSFLSRSTTNSVFTTGVIGNKILVFSFFFSFSLLLMGIEVPIIANWLGLVDPGSMGWLVVWVSVAIQIFVVETMKAIIRRIPCTKS